MDGRALLAGIDLEELPPARLLNVIHTVLTETGFTLTEHVPTSESPETEPSPEEWGTTPEAVASQDAFIGLGQ